MYLQIQLKVMTLKAINNSFINNILLLLGIVCKTTYKCIWKKIWGKYRYLGN